MSEVLKSDQLRDLLGCDFCGRQAVTKSMKVQSFNHILNGRMRVVTVTVPVYECSNCKFEYTDGEAENIRDTACRTF